MASHDLTDVILRAGDRVLNGDNQEIWVIERWSGYFSAFKVETAQEMIDHYGAKLVLKVSR